MKIQIVFLVVLLAFTLQVVGAQSQYTDSTSVVCGNGVCERGQVELLVGEEKSFDVGGKTHTIKLVKIEKVEDGGYYDYLSIDENPAMHGYVAKQQLGLNFFDSNIGYGPMGRPIMERADGKPPEPDRVYLYLYEDRICAVPDCAFKVDLTVYKKWNLVPLYFLSSGTGSASSEIEAALKRGTCKLSDFVAMYGYNPLKNEYVGLHSWGRSIYDLSSSFSSFSSLGSNEGVPIGIMFNSVWVYSNSECKLVAEIPVMYKKFLMFLSAAAAEAERQLSQPVAVKQPIAVREGGEATAIPQPTPTPQPKHGFAIGWNFLAGSPDMDGKGFDEMKGSCTIEKAYTFEAATQSWKKLETAPGPTSNFVFKVTNRCLFGAAAIAPPTIPLG